MKTSFSLRVGGEGGMIGRGWGEDVDVCESEREGEAGNRTCLFKLKGGGDGNGEGGRRKAEWIGDEGGEGSRVQRVGQTSHTTAKTWLAGPGSIRVEL